MKIPFVEHHLFQILKRFDQQWLPLDLFLSHYFRSNKQLGSKDRQKIANSAFGMVRWKLLLDHLAGKDSSWESRFAIYKGFQPEAFLLVNTLPPHVRVSIPEPLFQLLVDAYGIEKALNLSQISNTQAPITVRTNTLKTTRDELFDLLSAQYDVSCTEVSPLGIEFKKREPFAEMEAFKQGFFEVQDEASQLVALEVHAQSGDQVLDYCAGAAGKSLAIGAQMGNLGQLYLHDISEAKLEKAKKRMKRAGVQNAQYFSTNSPLRKKLHGKMDYVLVDAPCSGSGTYRRNPDLKWKFTNESLDNLIKEQRTIFEEALYFVKPNGKIVYATCSLLKEENERQVDYFLKQYPLSLEKSPFVSLPSFGGMDGFFAATFRRL